MSAGVRQLVWTLFACSVLGRAERLAFCEETAGQTVILLRPEANILDFFNLFLHTVKLSASDLLGVDS